MEKLLVANRGEIAIRIARTAADLGIATVAVHAEDEARALHVTKADEAVALEGSGAAAYLDIDQLVRIAADRGCDSVHPGYGFLSENAAFAEACEAAGLTFVGPSPTVLRLFGDKTGARRFAVEHEVAVARGLSEAASLEEALEFFTSLGAGGAVMVKAVAGGGGRGMRIARSPDELVAAYERCSSEAATSFGDGRVYVEELLEDVRHVEVQIAGDGAAAVHLWDRECSLQRNRQKVVEIAPASVVADDVRAALFDASVRMATAAGYRGVGTFEFLVGDGSFVFVEANARLQVEHTVTEEITGLDLVAIQLELAQGRSLAGIGLTPDAVPRPVGVAVQARVNLETLAADGSVHPSSGTITAFEPPSGPGVRVDAAGYTGYRTSTRYDSLLAKVVVHSRSGLAAATAKAARALSEFRIEGVATNVGFLQVLLSDDRVARGATDTQFLERHIADLVPIAEQAPRRHVLTGAGGRAGAVIDSVDPLAVLHHGKASQETDDGDEEDLAEGVVGVRAPMQGTVVEVTAAPGDTVAAGQQLAVMEAMKMEHVIAADAPGVVLGVNARVGEPVVEGHLLFTVEATDAGADHGAGNDDVDLDHIRPDLAEVLERHRLTLDDARPQAVERRRKTRQRTARENVDDLCDPGTFVEYSPLSIAARRRRNSVEELIEQTPADGLVMGLAQVNGDLFHEDRSRVAVMAYDYTVLAGTQGATNHLKLDRMAELAHRWKLPTVFFTEGGGGRPGDTEGGGFIRGFELWGKLSGLVPLVGINSGRCFAGNAAILGCCDVIIATKDSALGMGGPAMVEGGGLGVFRPEEIGPIKVMQANGTIDVLVEDEAEAVHVAKKYLSYFQGQLSEWSCADQRRLRHVIPENRVRAYDIRQVIALLADTGSVLELRPKFGIAMVTAFARIEGRAVGIIANNPMHLGGAIDSDASDKAARFLQICEAFDIPVVSLSDTPGNMVGPEAEKTGLIRHCSRLFVIGANLTVPILSVILRKSYGLGAIAMTGGSYQASMFSVAWPTGEFGGMGLEGSVKLGYRNELAAIADPVERKEVFDRMVERAYAAGKALTHALSPALDDVIDPADTRKWIVAGLRSIPPAPPRTEKKVPWIDTW